MNHEAAWVDLRERTERAANELARMIPRGPSDERTRIRGKLTGVELVLGYIEDYERLLRDGGVS